MPVDKLERKVVRRACQIGCEARGNVPVGRSYKEIPNWPYWYEQAWEEIVLTYARKNRNKINRMLIREIT